MRTSRAVAAAALLTAPVLLVGCSSGSSKDVGASATPAPEEVTTSPQAVRVGLQQIKSIAAQISAKISDTSAATTLDKGIEPIWSTIEGTVKKNDSDAYLALEDAFALLEDAVSSGDATKAGSGSDAVASTVSAYLAKFPS